MSPIQQRQEYTRLARLEASQRFMLALMLRMKEDFVNAAKANLGAVEIMAHVEEVEVELLEHRVSSSAANDCPGHDPHDLGGSRRIQFHAK